MARPAYGADDERPLSELFSSATDNLQHLLRREVELAKIEVQEQVDRAVKGAGMLAGTAVAGFVGLLMVSVAAALGLAEVMPDGVAFLVVGVVYLVVAAVLAAQARKRLSQFSPVPQQTVETLKGDVQVAKDAISSGATGEPGSAGAGQWATTSRRD